MWYGQEYQKAADMSISRRRIVDLPRVNIFHDIIRELDARRSQWNETYGRLNCNGQKLGDVEM